MPVGDRVFGNPLIGSWYSNDGKEFFPRYIEDHQDEFEWKLEDIGYGMYQYPYLNGVRLEYDEAA